MDSAEWNSFVDSSLRGYGFMLKTSTQGGQKVLTVAYVYPNSPAKNAGVARGDQIISIDGASLNDTGTEATNIFNEGLRPTKVAPHQFQILRAGQTLNVTMQAEAITLQQVEYKVLNVGSQKMGYLLFNSHVPGAEAYLIQAMTYFKQQAITDLVVDLRYNGGGYLAIANALGIHDANFYVASQCQMLKTIVAHNDLGLWKLMQEMPSRLKPVAANHHRNGAFSVDEEWLIANLCRRTVVGNDVKF
jgi:C-terminal processing protease CtpA/Prc